MALFWGRSLFVFPCFLIALLRSTWAVVPLWLVCLTLSILPLLIPDDMRFALGIRTGPWGMRDLEEIGTTILIPSVVQLAHMLRGPKITRSYSA